MSEKMFPTYKVRVEWSQDKDQKRFHYADFATHGLPEGRIWNGTSWTKMTKEELDLTSLVTEVEDWWTGYSPRLPNPSKPTISIKFDRFETWSISWFSHWTFDNGQDDDEVLASFRRFVVRTQQTNQEKGYWEHGYFRDPYCLMGAEDEWRWRGKDGPAPCRCQKCKESGIITIAH